MDKIIIKHIIEIRLLKRIFSFSNFSGELADFFVKELDAEKVRFSTDGIRIDVATKDLDKVFFASYENFGLQIEGSESFQKPIEDIEKFFNTLKSFGKYKFDSITRIGVKTLIFYHSKGSNFEDIKEKYKKMIFSNFEVMEEKTNTKLSDLAYHFDLKRENGIANVLTGPVTKDEVIQRFLGRNKCYEDVNWKNGFFFSIDYGKNAEKSDVSMDDLIKEVKDSIKSIEEIFTGFLNYFEVNENER